MTMIGTKMSKLQMAGHVMVMAGVVCLAGCGGPTASPEEVELSGVAQVRSAALERSIVLLQVQARSKDPGARANCIEALQPLEDPRVQEVLEQGLHDNDWIVRFAAAMSAGQRKELRLKSRLVVLAETDVNNSVRVAGIYALNRLGDTSYMNVIPKMITDPSATTRANTATVLGLLGNPSAIPLLQTRRGETDPRVRFENIAALARLGDSSAQRVVTSSALSKYAEDQWNAIVVCADLPKEVAANPLLLAFRQPLKITNGTREMEVRRQLLAARSLAKQGSVQGGNFCLGMLRDDDSRLRVLAALALGDILSPAGEGRLVPLLQDQDASVQRAAAAGIVSVWARAEARGGKK